MRARLATDKDVTGYASEFNTHAICEVLFYCEQFGADSVYCSGVEVQLSTGEWKLLSIALADKSVIPNNFNTYFRESQNDDERKQGYY